LETNGLAVETSRACFELVSGLTSIPHLHNIMWDQNETNMTRQISAIFGCTYTKMALNGDSAEDVFSSANTYLACDRCLHDLEEWEQIGKPTDDNADSDTGGSTDSDTGTV
jgi:hypothetical protein